MSLQPGASAFADRGDDGVVADLSGEERVVLVDKVSKDPYDWSPDGRLLLYRSTGASPLMLFCAMSGKA